MHSLTAIHSCGSCDWWPPAAAAHGGRVTGVTAATGSSGVLAVVTEPSLRGELDRMAAAVGVRIVHAGGAPEVTGAVSRAVSRKNWAAAAAVLLDEAAARRCGQAALPRRARVFVVTAAEPVPATWSAAVAVGAERVLILPGQEHELIRALADAEEAVRDDGLRGDVVAVVGGCGGAGASLFATALAHAAAGALLVDLDPWGGGLDLLVGCETAPGLRWPDLALQGGRLTWPAVRDALPRHRGVSVLSGTRRGYDLEDLAPGPVDAVIDAGRRGGVTVVCDLPRRPADAVQAALDAADLVVVVSPCQVRACAATAAMAAPLTAINPNVGLVVRGPAPGGLRAAEVAEVTGLPLLAAMKAQPQLADQLERGGLRPRRRSALAAAARRVLALLPRAGSPQIGAAA